MRIKLIKKTMSSNNRIGNLLANLYAFINSNKSSDLLMWDHTKGHMVNTDHYFQKEEDYGYTIKQEHIYHPIINRAFIPNQGPFIDKPTFDLNISKKKFESFSKHADSDLFNLNYSKKNRLGRLVVLPGSSDSESYLAMRTLDDLIHKSYKSKLFLSNYDKN